MRQLLLAKSFCKPSFANPLPEFHTYIHVDKTQFLSEISLHAISVTLQERKTMTSTAEGRVSNLKLSTTHLDGTSNHTASFMLGDQTVSLETRHLAIDEGDNLIVAGRMKHGLLQGFSYQNITKNVFVPFPHVLVWFLTIVTCIVPLFLLFAHPIFSLLCLPIFPGFFLFMALRISKGNEAIRSHPSFQSV